MFSDFSVRRSARNTGTETPAEQVTTMSGRQVRAPTRLNVDGESAPGSVQGEVSDNSKHEGSLRQNGRPTRAATRSNGANGRSNRTGDSMDEDEHEESEPDFGDDEEDDEHVPESNDEEDDSGDEELLDDDLDVQGDKSLVVKLAVKSSKLQGLAPEGLSSPVFEFQDASIPRDTDMKDAPAEDKTNGSALPRLTPGAAHEADSKEVESQTPSAAITATPLAFRGSPEKPPVTHQPAPVGVEQ